VPHPLLARRCFRSRPPAVRACLRELTLFLAPNINSYKRYAAGSFAPTAVAWAHDNRTCSLRVVGHGAGLRFENRAGGADLNPYLALSALIAAGLDGIDRGVDPGGPCELNLLALGEQEAADLGLRSMPMTLWHAVDHLESDDVLREGLGKTPEGDYVDYFVATKRAEVRASQADVTPWELERYLQAF
jgi:glutamine synthetase